MDLLELQEVRAGYGPTRVLHGVSITVAEGEIVSLLGANGAGKTTTLRAICGAIHWDGVIKFAGRSLHRTSTEDIVRGGVAHVNRCAVAQRITSGQLDQRHDQCVGHRPQADHDRPMET